MEETRAGEGRAAGELAEFSLPVEAGRVVEVLGTLGGRKVEAC